MHQFRFRDLSEVLKRKKKKLTLLKIFGIRLFGEDEEKEGRYRNWLKPFL